MVVIIYTPDLFLEAYSVRVVEERLCFPLTCFLLSLTFTGSKRYLARFMKKLLWFGIEDIKSPLENKQVGLTHSTFAITSCITEGMKGWVIKLHYYHCHLSIWWYLVIVWFQRSTAIFQGDPTLHRLYLKFLGPWPLVHPTSHLTRKLAICVCTSTVHIPPIWSFK